MNVMTDAVAHANDWNGAGGPWFGLVWLVFLAAVGFGIFAMTRRSRRAPTGGGAASPTAKAESVLAERYARGEITDDEYLAKVSVLRNDA